jgi:GxxExxY protein
MDLVSVERPVNALTGQILECAFRVSNELGCGFLEKVYENALVMELREHDLPVLQQPRIEVLYRDRVVGDYVADLIVSSKVIVEVKALRALETSHEAQALNYLKATHLEIALVLNFGRPRLQYRRMIRN